MKYSDLKNNKSNFFLIAGPCVVEDDNTVFEIAEEVQKLCLKYNIKYIFKASYRKANRSRLDSFTGIGDMEGLELINEVGEKFGIPTLTDIHAEDEADLAANYVDILQIPAFLSRQTDLLVAAARTKKIINIKKGQFLSPEAMQFAVDKVRKTGNENIILTDRGTMFGYNDLIIDFRGIPKMQKFGFPVVVDCTHSLQQPNQSSGITGGDPDMIETICKAAIATGANGLFIETHPEPARAKSDGDNMLPLEKLDGILEKLVRIRKAIAED